MWKMPPRGCQNPLTQQTEHSEPRAEGTLGPGDAPVTLARTAHVTLRPPCADNDDLEIGSAWSTGEAESCFIG